MTSSSDKPENPVTIKQASQETGLYDWKIRLAVKRGLIPSYTFGNSRRLVLLSQVRAAIKVCQAGGA